MTYYENKEVEYKKEIARLKSLLKITKKSTKRKILLGEIKEYEDRLPLVEIAKKHICIKEF